MPSPDAKHPLAIGLTGGIGSGKSAVADVFAALGVPVIDTDILARDLVQPGQAALSEIISAFGERAGSAETGLDRAWLRQRVFADADARKRLEAILHPRIRAEMLTRLQQADGAYAILVIPLLTETGQRELVDRVLVVDVDEATQRARVQARDGLDDDAVSAVLAAQAGREERLALADDLIENNAGLDELAAKVKSLHKFYTDLTARAG